KLRPNLKDRTLPRLTRYLNVSLECHGRSFLPVRAAAAAHSLGPFPNPGTACAILDDKINFLQVKRQIVAERRFLQGSSGADRAGLAVERCLRRHP
ncbi:hypothetical protein, partial [Neotabrizicola sp. sgz301269]|uniref:hypothetical protein n=1 Tax=Neotabrizicola sp. sgz301269 TaxID=3276282 RepID=UPI00376FCD20